MILLAVLYLIAVGMVIQRYLVPVLLSTAREFIDSRIRVALAIEEVN